MHDPRLSSDQSRKRKSLDKLDKAPPLKRPRSEHASIPTLTLEMLPDTMLLLIGGILKSDAEQAQLEGSQEDYSEASADMVSPTSTDHSIPNPSLKALVSLSSTNRRFRTFFQGQPLLNSMKNNAVTQLVTHVLHGRKQAVEDIIKANPGILRASCVAPVAADPTGRQFKHLTAYEAALCCRDVCGNGSNHEEMVEMMHRYFTKIVDGEAERQIQYNSVFPNGSNAMALQQQSDAEQFKDELLHDVIATIQRASKDDVAQQLLYKEFLKGTNETELALAIDTFRDTFTLISLDEQHENLMYFVKAVDAYPSTGNLFVTDPVAAQKLNLYWIMVLGHIQAVSFSENTKQIFYQALYNYIQNGEPNQRLKSSKHGNKRLSTSIQDTKAGHDFAAFGEGGHTSTTFGFLLPILSRMVTKLFHERYDALHRYALIEDCSDQAEHSDLMINL